MKRLQQMDLTEVTDELRDAQLGDRWGGLTPREKRFFQTVAKEQGMILVVGENSVRFTDRCD